MKDKGQVVQGAIIVSMSLGAQENDFTMKLYSLIYIINAAILFEACFNCSCKIVEGIVTELMARRTELENDSSKVDAFIRCVCWELVASADNIYTKCPCRDATKVGALWTKR
jgi:hypothetical protein